MVAECVWCQGGSLVQQWRWVIASKNTAKSDGTQSLQHTYTLHGTIGVPGTRKKPGAVQMQLGSDQYISLMSFPLSITLFQLFVYFFCLSSACIYFFFICARFKAASFPTHSNTVPRRRQTTRSHRKVGNTIKQTNNLSRRRRQASRCSVLVYILEEMAMPCSVAEIYGGVPHA